MIKVLGLALYGPKAASHRYRLSQYKQGLLDSNIDLEIHHLLDNQYLERKFEGKAVSKLNVLLSIISRLKLILSKNNYDVTILHCELIPFIPGWAEKLLMPKPYIFDFDDAWHLRYKLKRSNLFKFIYFMISCSFSFRFHLIDSIIVLGMFRGFIDFGLVFSLVILAR